MQLVRRFRYASAETRLKLGASALLVVPVLVLLLFAIGEMAGGDLSGAQHLVEAAPLLALLVAGWRYPRVIGFLLVGIGAIFFVIWLALIAPRGIPVLAWIAVGLIFFAPPVVAGWLMLKANRLPR